jgi:hypothetical protein
MKSKPKIRKPTRHERRRALAFHVRKMTESIDAYTTAVFNAWLQLNGVTDGARNLKIHLAEFERIAKGGTSKCK